MIIYKKWLVHGRRGSGIQGNMIRNDELQAQQEQEARGRLVVAPCVRILVDGFAPGEVLVAIDI